MRDSRPLTMRDVYSHSDYRKPGLREIWACQIRFHASSTACGRPRAPLPRRRDPDGSLYFVFGFRGLQLDRALASSTSCSAAIIPLWNLPCGRWPAGVAVLPVLHPDRRLRQMDVCSAGVRPGRLPCGMDIYVQVVVRPDPASKRAVTRLGGTPLLPFCLPACLASGSVKDAHNRVRPSRRVRCDLDWRWREH